MFCVETLCDDSYVDNVSNSFSTFLHRHYCKLVSKQASK